MKARADLLLVERGLFASRAKAREAIEAGLVLVDGVALKKPSDMVDSKSKIEAQKPYRWVSRGGLKLEAGLTHFQIDAKERICLDVGSSTGGFTDVLLSRGAAKVFAVDVGQGQLHERLLRNKRVVSLEQTDARNLDATLIPEPPSLVVCDASFISLKLVLPQALAEDGALDGAGRRVPLKFRSMVLPDTYQDHDKPERLYAQAGLDAKAIVAKVLSVLGREEDAAKALIA